MDFGGNRTLYTFTHLTSTDITLPYARSLMEGGTRYYVSQLINIY